MGVGSQKRRGLYGTQGNLGVQSFVTGESAAHVRVTLLVLDTRF